MGSEGFVGGNVRTQSIKEIWDWAPELQMSRSFVIESLWGFCRECYYGEYCKGGCLWTAATLLGKLGNNPYCHHRALEMLTRGKRERMVLVRAAEGRIRDTPCFALEVEDAPHEWVGTLPVLEHTSAAARASD
jgi:radical SAM protein with 4Fe4S-binding SPASM domain